MVAGRFAAARQLLLPRLADSPDGPTWCLLSQCDLALGDPVRAVQAADQAVAIAPDLEWAHRLRSEALRGLRQHDLAVDAARTSVALAPHSWPSYVALAEAHLASWGQQEQARTAARTAVPLAPQLASTHITLGRAEYGMRDFAAAERCYRRALEIDPGNAVAHNNLGVVALRSRQPDTAMKMFATSSRIDPRSKLSPHNWNIALMAMFERLVLTVLGLGALLSIFAGLQTDSSTRASSKREGVELVFGHPGLATIIRAGLGFCLLAAIGVSTARRLRTFEPGTVRAFLRNGDAVGPALVLAGALAVTVFAALMQPAGGQWAFVLLLALWWVDRVLAKARARRNR